MNSGFFWIVTAIACVLLVLLILICMKSNGLLAFASVENRRTCIAKSWIPGNLIEEKIHGFRDHKVGRSTFINTLVTSELLILTDGEGKTDPHDCDSLPGAGRSRLIPVYTSLYQLRQHLKNNEGAYTHIQIVKMRSWIPLLPEKRGLIINPDHESAVELSPEDIELLKQELS